MTLEVFTCRIGTRAARDPDVLLVTREEADAEGVVGVFAPSWAILRPVLDARKNQRRGFVFGISNEDRAQALEEARAIELAAWREYVPAFLAEMRVSYRRHRPEWDRVLGRGRVVLACACKSPDRCHRTILAARIFPALGATYGGELVSTRTTIHLERVEIAA